mmetsp:Transcript_35890/g.111128  ORF Transcript_35890/g.111128 Transcript_35890/m.111128 type:complete len:92 (-) Transcript_35890:139-414(-)
MRPREIGNHASCVQRYASNRGPILWLKFTILWLTQVHTQVRRTHFYDPSSGVDAKLPRTGRNHRVRRRSRVLTPRSKRGRSPSVSRLRKQW